MASKKVPNIAKEYYAHTLVVVGELDMLLKVHIMFHDPEAIAHKFLYKWVATEGMNKNKCRERKNQSLTNRVAHCIAKNWGKFTEQQKKEMTKKLSEDLWQKIFYFIPLTDNTVLQIAQFIEKEGNGRFTLMESSMWKLLEKSVMLYEFVSKTKLSLHSLKKWSKFFPSLHFLLRITSKQQQGDIDVESASELFVIRSGTQTYCSNLEIMSTDEQIIQQNQQKKELRRKARRLMNSPEELRRQREREYKQKLQQQRKRLFTSQQQSTTSPTLSPRLQREMEKDDQPIAVKEYLPLLRGCSNMAIHCRNTAPQEFSWVPLFNHNALDMLYAWQRTC